MRLVDKVRKVAKKGEVSARKKAETAERREAATVRQQLRHDKKIASTQDYKEAIKQIDKDARAGDSETSYIIGSPFEDAHWPTNLRTRADVVRRMLEKEGFKVELDSSTMEPFGSDPLFWHTVYTHYLKVSWEWRKMK